MSFGRFILLCQENERILILGKLRLHDSLKLKEILLYLLHILYSCVIFLV